MTKKKNDESITLEQSSPKYGDEFFDENGNFDWDGLESNEGSLSTPNPYVKINNFNDKVYSKASYAQWLYNLYSNFNNFDVLSDVDIGSIYEGKIYSITEKWLTVDINYRELIFVNLYKEPKEYQELKPGDKISILIEEKSDGDVILGSISGGMKQKLFNQLKDEVNDPQQWKGTVEEMIENGGYVVDIQGVKCFMPGSLADINKLYDFNMIIGKELYVLPVSFSNQRGTIVVSHKDYLKSLVPQEVENLKKNIDQKQSGFVTGTTKYGVFCEFNDCLTGMIHINDLNNEFLERFKNNEIKPGESIDFWVREIVNNYKIILTQKEESLRDPWKDIEERYNIPVNVEATVKSVKDYGLFVEIEKDVVGLLHISELGEELINMYSNGDTITVRIYRINSETKKVFLKLPE